MENDVKNSYDEDVLPLSYKVINIFRSRIVVEIFFPEIAESRSLQSHSDKKKCHDGLPNRTLMKRHERLLAY